MGPSLSGLTLRAADAAEPAVDGGPAWLAVDPRPLDWNGPAARPFVRFRDEDLARPVIDLLQAIARRQPDRIAVTATDGALTFAELWARLSGVAQAVAARTQPDDLVGLLLPASTAFPVAALACLAAGRPFVALDPHYPEQWLSDVQTEARPAMLLRPDEVRDLARAPVSDAWRPTPAGPDEPACVLFTSGSTGKPKGIVNSQRNLLQRVAQSVNAAHLNADDRFLTLASLCTIVGIRDLLTALLAGGSVRLVDPGRLDAREIVDLVRADGITVLFAFPALLRSVLEAGPGAAGETLRLVRVGGDTTLWSDIDLIRGWLPPGAAIQSIYAATEAPMMQWFAGDAARADDLRIPIGYPLPGNRLAIVDGRGRAVRPGEVGELIVASPYVAVGRWTGGRFVADPAGDGRTFRTGDLVRQRPDGLIERIGRQDRQVKIRGARVELDGVEALIRQHPGVRDVGVLVRVRRPGAAATLVACVHAQDSAPAGLLQDLRARMASAPPAMRPGRYHLVDEVPRLPSSKLDTRALAALDAARAPAAAAPRPNPAAGGDPIARTVAEVWRSVLGAPVRGPDDDFFEAGGDSLMALTFVLELERALGVALSVGLIGEAPRFGQLCAALRAPGGAASAALVTLKPGEGAAPVFVVPGLGGAVSAFLPMARRMTWPGAVLGFQAPGLAGKAKPHASVGAMAADYLRELKARQPEGPYHLCGYSFGGLVAFEMACRLREAGDEVGLVALFDTTRSPLTWPARAWAAILGRRLAALWRRSEGRTPHPPVSLRLLDVCAHALLASARYRPGVYDGELTLFSPADREPGLPPLETVWRPHAREVVVASTGGSHRTMLSGAHAASTAALLTQRLAVA